MKIKRIKKLSREFLFETPFIEDIDGEELIEMFIDFLKINKLSNMPLIVKVENNGGNSNLLS